VGDSIIWDQLKEFCGSAPNNRKSFCMPGASLDNITATIKEATHGAINNDLFIIHTGTVLTTFKGQDQKNCWRIVGR